MAEIRPFAAIRYGAQQGRDISARIAPPYDILGQKDKDKLAARARHNIVLIDLPYIPPGKAGPEEVYEAAARDLRQWQNDGVLITEPDPALYVYHQRFTHEGRHYTRRLLMCRMRIEEFGKGSVFPHEKTFGGPKEDRLALMKTTHCQLSPVFALYVDPKNEIADLLQKSVAPEPDLFGTLEDVENRLWAVTDATLIERVTGMLHKKKVYIADGHHRYLTAGMYRDWLAQREGPLAPDHAAQFVFVALAAMDDPGMLILPTHRVLVDLGDISDEKVLEAWGQGLRIEPATGWAPSADFELYSGRTDRRWAATITNRDIVARLEPAQCAAWQQLDLAYLHRYLLDEMFVKKLNRGREAQVRYLKTVGGAEGTAREENGLAIIVRPTTMAQLRAVSEAGGLMPQKSTYFFPKLATGLVINPLY